MRHARHLRALLIACLVPAGGLLADATWTIPGIVHADGLNGTHFVSDLTLTNPGSLAAHVTLRFFPAAAQLTKVLTLEAGQTVVAADVALVHFGITAGAGGLTIASDQPLLIRAKTYNTAASGTYGVALPVLSSDRLLGAGDVADSLWITQDASGSSGYRTNVAVVFPDDEGGEATVTVYDADGHEVGSKNFSLDAPGLQQFAVGSFAGAVPVGRAQVQVIRGSAAGYSVVVDNVTGDSSLFAFEELPAGWQDVLVNGVARANGRNGTFFRTDGRFYNPASEDAKVTVAFHAAQSDNSSAVTRDFTVPAGRILDVVDVLDSLLGLPVGSSGALRFHSEGPVAIRCRTSNVDPSGAKPGTFGAQQRPTPLLSFLMSGDAGAVVTGIRQNSTFRTNVGFAAGADGAAYALTLKTAGGATVATTTGSLGVFGWTQPNVQDLFPGVTIPDDATLQVKATSGSVDVYDSSIDNASGDPVVTPIAPLPASIPSSAMIGPQGGSIRSDDGALTLKIPAGALGAPTPFSIATVTNDAPGALGGAYDVSPAGLAFAKPALLSLRYGLAGVPVRGIDAVSIAVLGGTGWAALTGGRIDTTSRSLVVPLRNTSPSSALAGPRNVLAGNSTRVAPVTAIKVNHQEWIPTGGRMNLSVSMQAAPTSTGEGVFFPLGEQPGTSVTWRTPSQGSLSGTSTTTTTYTAPLHIAKVVESVGLKVKVVTGSGTYTTSAIFLVIRRQWRLRFQFEVDIACSHGPYDTKLKYDETHFRTLSFDDNMVMTADSSIPLASIGDYTFETCNPSCRLTITGPSELLQVTNLAGVFFPFTASFLVLGNVSVKKASPGHSVDCMPGPDHAELPPVDYDSLIPPAPTADGLWPLSNLTQNSAKLGLPIETWVQWESVP